jgi:hypothetical protein
MKTVKEEKGMKTEEIPAKFRMTNDKKLVLVLSLTQEQRDEYLLERGEQPAKVMRVIVQQVREAGA